MGFIENQGQIKNSDIKYYFNSNSSSIGFEKSKIIIMQKNSYDIEISFPNSLESIPIGQNKTDHYTNFFLGNNNYIDLMSFMDIYYINIYRNIDLHFLIQDNQLKYEFIVHPGGIPSIIKIHLSNNVILNNTPKRIIITSNDNNFSNNFLTDTNLIVYQNYNNQISAYYKSCGNNLLNCYSYNINTYDKNKDLIIDPYYLGFSTYLGGTNQDIGRLSTLDSKNDIYIVGETFSNNFPVNNSLYSSISGSYDAFITKFDSSGNLLYSTYLGGSSGNEGWNVVVDNNDNVIIVGGTSSTNFPTVNAVQSSYNGGFRDAFVTKLNSAGNIILFSTYLGGSGDDVALGLTVDVYGNIYVTGMTTSIDFLTKNGIDNTYNDLNSQTDAFVAKFNSNGTLLYSTYLGGNNLDEGWSIAVDQYQNCFVTGWTQSTNFPIVNGMFKNLMGGVDAFISELSTNGSSLLFSTYFGGSSSDYGIGIAVDNNENLYLTGSTGSSDFPTLNAYNNTFGGTEDAFITKLNVNTKNILWSTYIGGSRVDWSNNIKIDKKGNSYITGYTNSTNFPVINSNITSSVGYNVFVTQVNQIGNVTFSTYFGGNNNDFGQGILIDTYGNIIISGYTQSNDFPVLNSFNNTFGGIYDAFLTKLNTAEKVTVNVNLNDSIIKPGIELNISVIGKNNGKIIYNWNKHINFTIFYPFNITSVNSYGNQVLNFYVFDGITWVGNIFSL